MGLPDDCQSKRCEIMFDATVSLGGATFLHWCFDVQLQPIPYSVLSFIFSVIGTNIPGSPPYVAVGLSVCLCVSASLHVRDTLPSNMIFLSAHYSVGQKVWTYPSFT